MAKLIPTASRCGHLRGFTRMLREIPTSATARRMIHGLNTDALEDKDPSGYLRRARFLDPARNMLVLSPGLYRGGPAARAAQEDGQPHNGDNQP